MANIIFLVGDQSRTGGTERAVANVASHLAIDENARIFILSLHGANVSTFPIDDRVSLSTILHGRDKKTVWRMLAFFLLVPLRLAQAKADVVIAVDVILFLFLLPLKLLPRRRLVCWEHFNATVNLGIRRRDWARWLASRFADAIVLLTFRDREEWVKRYPWSERRLCVIPNMSPFLPGVIERGPNRERRNVVLAVGRLVPEKGFDLLLEAWAHIPKEVRRGWVLRIVGGGPDKPKLEKKCTELNLQASVEFFGASSDVAEEYRRASFLVLSSRFEGLPLVLIEALSFGLPCVAFDCMTGPSEIISDGVNGRLVPPQDTRALALVISDLLTDPTALDRLRSKARFGLDRFLPENVTNQWRSLLRRGNP